MTSGGGPPAQGPVAASVRQDGGLPAPGVLRGDIEGLRAIAVLMVLLYHAGLPGVSGGFAGVDVFFVISGYLITNQLVREASTHRRISLTRFYARRARRLLPAATLVLLTTTIASWWLLPRGRHAELGLDVLAATGYVLNWSLAARQVDYLAEDAAASLVQHYWSLSVEEQFYVLWPLLIIAVLWATRRYRLPLLPLLSLALVVVVATSLAWSFARTASSPQTAYFVTTTRIWQLGTGALLVLATPLLARLPRPAAATAAWTGLALIATTLFTASTATPWPGTAALLPTLGAAAVIAGGATWPANPAARLLSHRPMLFLGAISYSLYLWHWPALRLLGESHPDAALPTRLAVAAASILAAWATLRLVENPIRHHPTLTTDHRRTLRLGFAAMALTATTATTLWATAPALDILRRDEVLDLGAHVDQDVDDTRDGDREERAGKTSEEAASPPILSAGAIGLVDPASRALPTLEPVSDPTGVYTRSGPVFPDPGLAIEDIPSAAYEQNCQVDREDTELVDEDACWFGDLDGTVTAALVGDSKMLQWLPALEHVARSEGWRLKVHTKSACGFAGTGLYPECHEYNRALSQRLSSAGHVPDLVITSMVQPGGDELGASVAEHLRPIADAGAKIVILADNPSPDRDELGEGMTAYRCVARNEDDYTRCSYEPGTGSGTPALAAAAERLDVPLVDLGPWICPDVPSEGATCPVVVGRVLAFRQGSHLTATYVESLTPHLHHALVGAGVATTAREDIVWEIRQPGTR